MNKNISSELGIGIILLAIGIFAFALLGSKGMLFEQKDNNGCKNKIQICGSGNSGCRWECQDDLKPKKISVGDENKIACPADAKICSDGSYVSRSAPNCEFAQCPQTEVSCKSGGVDNSKLSIFLDKLNSVNSNDFITAEKFFELKDYGLSIFIKGKCFNPEAFQSGPIGSIGIGADEVNIYRLLMKGESDNAQYYYQIYVNIDNSNIITEYYWDYPIDSKSNIVSEEQLQIFLRYIKQKEFQRMRFKGYDIFKEKFVLTASYKTLFADYKKEENLGKAKYVFFEIVSDSGAANVSLVVDTNTSQVINFSAIEARREIINK